MSIEIISYHGYKVSNLLFFFFFFFLLFSWPGVGVGGGGGGGDMPSCASLASFGTHDCNGDP